MEYGSRVRIALFAFIAIVVLIFSIWGVSSIARSVFKPNKSKTNTTEIINPTDYAKADTSAKLQTGGPIVGDEKYVSYEIEITENSRKITTYTGYQHAVASFKQYDNNTEAYRTFLVALQNNNFTKRLNGTTTDDETAACATGRRFVYILADQQEPLSRLWNTSCSSGNRGTMGGSATAIRSLFKAQIPDIATILTGPFSVLQ